MDALQPITAGVVGYGKELNRKPQRLARSLEWGHLSVVLADELPSPEQIVALRAMSGQRRLKAAEQLFWSARKIKSAGVRTQHPDWPEAQIKAEVDRLFLHARE